MNFVVDPQEFRQFLRETFAEVISAADWPAGRVALAEAEAAACCGVARHVLRDLRLSGVIQARRLGRKIVYTRADLLAALERVKGLSRGGRDVG